MFCGVFQQLVSQGGEQLMGTGSRFIQSGLDVKDLEELPRIFAGDSQPAIVERFHRIIFMLYCVEYKGQA